MFAVGARVRESAKFLRFPVMRTCEVKQTTIIDDRPNHILIKFLHRFQFATRRFAQSANAGSRAGANTRATGVARRVRMVRAPSSRFVTQPGTARRLAQRLARRPIGRRARTKRDDQSAASAGAPIDQSSARRHRFTRQRRVNDERTVCTILYRWNARVNILAFLISLLCFLI